MASDIPGVDEQDQSEVFDEDNLDEDGEFRTAEELPDVLDVTKRRGDAGDDPEVDEADFDDASALNDEDVEDDDAALITRDAYDETDEEDVRDPDVDDGVDARASHEVDLEYLPDIDGRRGAQGSARHFESRGVLGDEALRDLGYAEEPSK